MTGASALSERHFGALLRDLAHRADVSYANKSSVWHARVRYAGQGHELDIACTPGDSGTDLAERFAAAHRARYGFTLDRVVEIIALRVAVSGDALPIEFSSTEREDRRVVGPAVEMLTDCTMVVAAGWTARPLAVGGWMVERQ
jgi:N-methylhydantoinase A/oxoprolinase/acetone carboxylase beta subunit